MVIIINLIIIDEVEVVDDKDFIIQMQEEVEEVEEVEVVEVVEVVEEILYNLHDHDQDHEKVQHHVQKKNKKYFGQKDGK